MFNLLINELPKVQNLLDLPEYHSEAELKSDELLQLLLLNRMIITLSWIMFINNLLIASSLETGNQLQNL